MERDGLKRERERWNRYTQGEKQGKRGTEGRVTGKPNARGKSDADKRMKESRKETEKV